MIIRTNLCGVAEKCIDQKRIYKKYVTKDVKLSICHQSWLVDKKLTLETVLELIYLWSQSFSINEIIHELKISNKTAVE